ncbi:MAG: hypothetical protein ACK42Z_05710 [Candidatus Kapaibacteriota bacterium]
MKLFLNINSNINEVAKSNNLILEEIEEVKISEKQLAKPRRVLKLVRSGYDEILFGCLDIEFQRFIPFMLLYILLSKPKRGCILDEFGKKIKFSFFKTLFVTIPLLFLETFLSVLIVLFSYIYYFVWRKIIIRHSASSFGE